MFELGQLNLQLASRVRARPSENVEDQLGAVEHLALEDALEVTALGGGQFVVENDGVDVAFAAQFGELVRLSRANECAGDGPFEFLHPISHNVAAARSWRVGPVHRGNRATSHAGRDLSSTAIRNTRSVRFSRAVE